MSLRGRLKAWLRPPALAQPRRPRVELRVDGRLHTYEVEPGTALSEVGGHFRPCHDGACGGCDVEVDGAVLRACATPVRSDLKGTVRTRWSLLALAR